MQAQLTSCFTNLKFRFQSNQVPKMLPRVMNCQVEFFGKQWDFADIITLAVMVCLHGLSLLAPFQFTWGALLVAVVLYFVTVLGITISYHRNLSHRSFKVPRWLEYLFAYCGVLSLQGSPIEWVSTHRYHHQFTDKLKDPHTPSKGFWFSHINWIFDYHSRFGSYQGKLKNVGDLECQLYYRFLHYTYLSHSIALGVVLYVAGGLPFLVWGLAVRLVFVFHVIFSVNSFCHNTWGKQVWDTGDASKNNWLLGLLVCGEGWHHNHHAFEYSARHGLEWWQIDISWYVIRFLEEVGLATDVKLPTETQKKRKGLVKNLIVEDKVSLTS